jgi:hypothetical protein
MRRTLQPNEREDITDQFGYNPSKIYTNTGQRFRNAISDYRGPTFPPPVVEGQFAVFACCRRLQSFPFLTVTVQAVCINGELRWALLHSKEQPQLGVDLFPNHRNTLSVK